MVDRARERLRDVLGPRRLVAPLHIRRRDARRIAVGQVRLHRDLRTHLLARGEEQRRLVRACIEDAADRVAHARSSVQVGVAHRPARLREAVRHAHHHQLLQAQHVAEVIREVLQHSQLRRARVAEDACHPMRAQQLERRLADARHQ
jgi:hypothetical protein